MIADKACYERGCACHDPRENDGVEVIEKKPWVGLTDKKISEIATSHPLTWVNLNTVEHRQYFARAIESELREKNHGN